MPQDLVLTTNTVPLLSGASVKNMPSSWIRGTALIIAASLTAPAERVNHEFYSAFDYEEHFNLPSSAQRAYTREKSLLLIPESNALSAAIDSDHGKNGYFWRRLPEGPIQKDVLVSAIEKDLIKVRRISYSNPGAMSLAFEQILLFAKERFDVIFDVFGYRDHVQARNRRYVAQDERDEQEAFFERMFGLSRKEMIDELRREGHSILEATYIVNSQLSDARATIAPAIMRPTLDSPPATSLEVSNEIARRLITSEEDERAMHALRTVDAPVEFSDDDAIGDTSQPQD